ncbi:MAG: hypothetical protein JHD16_14700 [Solirubrobacteraceae bacterium]|nr:hypothetical protein [Solirubrobacteraceae bacterium]
MMLSLSHSRPMRAALAFVAAGAASVSLGAAPAAAVPAPNESVVTLDPVVKTALDVAKIKIVPKGAAKGGSAGIYYPVVNSRGMSDKFIGTLKHQGGFEFKLGTLRVGARNFVVQTKNRTPVSGVMSATPVLNSMAMPFELPFSDVRVTSVQKTSTMIIAKYKLSADPAIAQLINDTLKVKLLTPGAPWASVETRIKRP